VTEKVQVLGEALAKNVARIIIELKGEDIIVLDLSRVSNILDFFVIATGASKTHLRGIAEEIQKELKKEHIYPLHIEGYNEANWILLDYGDLIIHLFDEKNRSFYQIERLWGDATEVSV